MKLKPVEKKDNKHTFEMSETSATYVNTLRRIFASKVPTMAITYVEFKKNGSSLYDEMLAHRLGLLALKTNLKSYNVAQKDAEESPATHVKLTLKVKGPKIVYASDLKSADPAIVPVHPKTPLVKLFEGQDLELIATAKLGTGEEHAKHQTGAISYYYKPKITVDTAKAKNVIDKYPPQVKEGNKIVAEKINTAALIDACKDVSDAVKIEYDDPHTEFVFIIESWGQLTSTEIVEEGIKIYNKELEEFDSEVKKIK